MICVNCRNDEVMAGVPNSKLCGECYAGERESNLYYGWSE
jgi:hypothetical protein